MRRFDAPSTFSINVANTPPKVERSGRPEELFPDVLKKAQSLSEELHCKVTPSRDGLLLQKNGLSMQILMRDGKVDIECKLDGVLTMHLINPHSVVYFGTFLQAFFTKK
ncbi:hypothetical protein KA012_01735 [Candidatus Woesebacteria bacterium]|nr:hypothetical protein [Candidatus Woesebacteria bacterium]MBP9718195.1 hypothetical protein [Candidatus Gracilibacteria bacterium]